MPRKGANLFQGQLDPEDHRQALALMEKSQETRTKFLKRLINQEYEKQFTDGGEIKEVLKAKEQIKSLQTDIRDMGHDIVTIKGQNEKMANSFRTVITLLDHIKTNTRKESDNG